MIKNCVFDFGRVLVGYDMHRLFDSFFGGDRAKATWFDEHVVAEPWVRRLDIGEPFEQCIQELQAKFPDYADAIRAYDVRYQEIVGDEVEGMYALLCDLKSRGYGLYGLTNWSDKVYEVIRNHPIFELLDGALISSEVHLLKPDVRIYDCLLQRYGLLGSECVFVDDRKENVNGALEAGYAAAVHFENVEQLKTEFSTLLSL